MQTGGAHQQSGPADTRRGAFSAARVLGHAGLVALAAGIAVTSRAAAVQRIEITAMLVAAFATLASGIAIYRGLEPVARRRRILLPYAAMSLGLFLLAASVAAGHQQGGVALVLASILCELTALGSFVYNLRQQRWR